MSHDASNRRESATRNAPSSWPGPGTGGGYSIDPNEAAKATTEAALAEIPEAGAFLSLLVEIFWPGGDNPNSVWESIESRVETLVNQKIDASVYSQTEADLTGLQNVLANYAGSAKPGHTTEFTSQNWTTARGLFAQRMPHFRAKGSELLLLPLWAQAANMHLSLLRDGVLFGMSWGWDGTDHDSVVAELKAAITDYTAWAPRIFGWGISGQLSAGGVNYYSCQPFRASNKFHQQMVPAVLDVAQLWPLFDPTIHLGPATPDEVYLTSEIYSDPWRTADNSGLFLLPWQHPTRPPAQITVWSEPNLIDAVQVAYPDGGGPDGVTQTARMGAGSGNPTTISVNPGNPVTTVNVWAGDVVQGLQFTFKDGTTTPHLGSSEGTKQTFDFYDHDAKSGRVLSSVYVNGKSIYYNNVDAIVFGFRYEGQPPAPLASLRARFAQTGKDQRHRGAHDTEGSTSSESVEPAR